MKKEEKTTGAFPSTAFVTSARFKNCCQNLHLLALLSMFKGKGILLYKQAANEQ